MKDQFILATGLMAFEKASQKKIWDALDDSDTSRSVVRRIRRIENVRLHFEARGPPELH